MPVKIMRISAFWFYTITITTLAFLSLFVGIIASLIVNLSEHEIDLIIFEVVRDLNLLFSMRLPEGNNHLLTGKIFMDINFFLVAGEFALGFIALVIIAFFFFKKTGHIKIDDITI